LVVWRDTRRAFFYLATHSVHPQVVWRNTKRASFGFIIILKYPI